MSSLICMQDCINDMRADLSFPEYQRSVASVDFMRSSSFHIWEAGRPLSKNTRLTSDRMTCASRPLCADCDRIMMNSLQKRAWQRSNMPRQLTGYCGALLKSPDLLDLVLLADLRIFLPITYQISRTVKVY